MGLSASILTSGTGDADCDTTVAWGIFSTVDMHPTRQDALLSLVNLGSTCRKLRKEVRVIIFRCIRTPTVQHVEEVIRNRRGWAKLVRRVSAPYWDNLL